jgi:hypothetical protein
MQGQAGFVGAEEFHVANLVESLHLGALVELFCSSQSAHLATPISTA